MSDIVLNIQPSYWNVLKFVILSIVTTPLLEFALHRFIDTKATYDVLRGKNLSFSDSRLGLFSLHSMYWGPPRNKLLLILVALPVLSAELLFEFSFSVDTIDIASAERVWLAKPHGEMYDDFFGDGNSYYTFYQESRYSRQFSLGAAEVCIHGLSQMSRIGSRQKSSDGIYTAGFQFRMNDSYVIRKPYLSLDNSSIVCGASKTIGHVSFVVPAVVAVDSTKAEGVDPRGNSSDSRFRNAVAKGGFEVVRKVHTTNLKGDVWANDLVMCTWADYLGILCALKEQNRFALAIVSEFFQQSPTNFTISVVLEATGSPVEGLQSYERRLQYMSILADNLLLQSPHEGESASQRLISKEKLELLSMLMLVAANEEGAGGTQKTIGFRSILTGQKESVTVKRMAVIPITFLLSLFVLLVAAGVVLSVRIALIHQQKRNKITWREWKGAYRVESTGQWLRQKLSEDLCTDGDFEAITASDIVVKMSSSKFQEYVQILP